MSSGSLFKVKGLSNELTKPRVGFVGLGWIGRNRLRALQASDLIDVAAVFDADECVAKDVAKEIDSADVCGSYESMLHSDLDAVVLATPSALHAQQVHSALDQGLAVFCQKPLAMTRYETCALIAKAREKNRLLGVDLSYRTIDGMQDVRTRLQRGEIGKVFHVDLVFHNAYGPDKAWFYQRRLSGGGCVVDLATHLIDLAVWVTGQTTHSDVSAQLFARNENGEMTCLSNPTESIEVEQVALAQWRLGKDIAARLACSWKLQAGCEAKIEASFYGEYGAFRVFNLQGSFYDFAVEECRGTNSNMLTSCDSEWGGRAIQEWAAKLVKSRQYDDEIELLIPTTELIDKIYQS